MIRIEIETDNAAFGKNKKTEVARILRRTAERFIDHTAGNSRIMMLGDFNGKTVGKLEVID